MRRFGDRLDRGSRTTFFYSPGISGIESAAQMGIDPAKVSRGIFNPKFLENPSLRVVKLPDGRLRGTYDVNKFVGAMFEASPEAGHNIVLAEGFNKEGPRAGSRFTAEWKRDGEVRYVAAWTQEHWMKGKVDERCELRYGEFVANPRVSPDLFTLRALELGEDSIVLDVRPGWTKSYNVGDPKKLGEMKVDTLARQLESLPLRRGPE